MWDTGLGLTVTVLFYIAMLAWLCWASVKIFMVIHNKDKDKS